MPPISEIPSFQPHTVLPGDDVTSLLLPSSSSNNNNTITTTTMNNINAQNTVTTLELTNTQQKSSSKKQQIKLGRGLVYNSKTQTIYCTLAGSLLQSDYSSTSSSNPNKKPNSNSSSSNNNNTKPKTYYIQSNTKRYIPQQNDRVIGILEEKFGDYYKVNIFGPHPALLPILAFENATKRNRPILNIGATIYCRLEKLSPGNTMDPILSCQVGNNTTTTSFNNSKNNTTSSSSSNVPDGGANRKDWMTDENTYGELKGGTHIQISLGLARRLLQPDSVVLTALGKHNLAFEVAIGVNGILWVHSTDVQTTVLICNVIQNSEVMQPDQVRGMVRDLVKRISK